MNVVITGANGGIGVEFVKQYRRRGERVYALCRSDSSAISDAGVTRIEPVDLTRPSDLSSIVEQLQGVEIDILINNAGLFKNETLDHLMLQPECARSTIDQQFQLNALAPLMLTSSLLAQMKPYAKIIFITSRMGSIEDNNSGAYYGYRMSKAALNAAAKSLAVDLAAKQIAVGIYHPGFVQTKMTGFQGDMTPENSVKGLMRRIDQLSLVSSSRFYHSNGESLPW